MAAGHLLLLLALLLPSAAANSTAAGGVCDTLALASHIIQKCLGSDRSLRCCDKLIWMVDEEGGGRCLCGAATQMARLGAPTPYGDLYGIYAGCGGLYLQAVRRHHCPDPPTPPAIHHTPPAKHHSPPAKHHTPPPKSSSGDEMSFSMLFKRVLYILLEVLLVVLLPALVYAAYRFASVIKEWMLRGWAWLERRIMPSDGMALGTDENGLPPRSTNHDHTTIQITEINPDTVNRNEELQRLFPFCSSTGPNAESEMIGNSTSLAISVLEGLSEVIKCLIEASENPNIPNMDGRTVIELAAMYGTSKDVEILFPFTSPIPAITNWSADGIISHMKLEKKQLEDDDSISQRKSLLRKLANDAFRKGEYVIASAFYTQAVRVDHYDASVFADRSLCWLCAGDGRRALHDALMCKILEPKWTKAYFRQGQALMLLKNYEKACDALAKAVEIDPRSDELRQFYRDAMELKKRREEAQVSSRGGIF
ncbi:unnamed protein product [Urochloa humidicola]